MALTKLDKRNWQTFFDRVSRASSGRRAEIEVAGLDLGAQVEAEWLPLLGIAYDPKKEIVEIALDNVDHMIQKPRDVFVEQDATGLASLEVTDGDGRQHIVQLREPLMLPPPR
jgi:hypothetical protein